MTSGLLEGVVLPAAALIHIGTAGSALPVPMNPYNTRLLPAVEASLCEGIILGYRAIHLQ